MPQPLDPNSDEAARVEAITGQKVQSIPLWDSLEISQCYWNADAVAREIGGRAVCCYLWTTFDGVMIEGMHHAVVEAPDGRLFDVTQYGPAVTETVTITLDPGSVPHLPYPVYVDHIIVPLGHDEKVRQLQVAHREACAAARAYTEAAVEWGATFNRSGNKQVWSPGSDPEPEHVQKLRHARNEAYARAKAIDAELAPFYTRELRQ